MRNCGLKNYVVKAALPQHICIFLYSKLVARTSSNCSPRKKYLLHHYPTVLLTHYLSFSLSLAYSNYFQFFRFPNLYTGVMNSYYSTKKVW